MMMPYDEFGGRTEQYSLEAQNARLEEENARLRRKNKWAAVIYMAYGAGCWAFGQLLARWFPWN